VIAAVVTGALAGLGLFLVWRGACRRPDLAARVRALTPATALTAPPVHRAVRRGAERRRRDLRIVGRTPQRHALDRLLAATAGLATPALAAAVLTVGGVAAPHGVLLLVGLCAAAAGFALPDVLVRRAAAERRRDVVHGLSAYLDLVTVLLAGSAGTETALWGAADAGDGWVFAELRRALDEARVRQRSPWEALGALGHELDVADLVELAASVRLAGTHGARVRATLTARADALRARRRAEAESAAAVATEQMALPNVALFAAFLVFIGYPAVAAIVGGG
jgi:tight adherence protein C